MAFDPYAELGVARGADDATIKKAYRTLARELHPDVNPDNADAEARFKRVSEAYAVLSDPEKRGRFDRYGEAGLRDGFDERAWQQAGAGFDASAFEDLFGGFSGFGGFDGFQGFGVRGGGTGGRKGRDLEMTLRVGFEQAARGFQTKFRYRRPVACTSCSGTGRTGNQPCAVCGGAGQVERDQSLTVNVPRGADNGDRIRLKGKGGQGRGGAPSGDLLLTLAVTPHETFEREGLDLVVRPTIDPVAALLGTRAEVPTLDGTIRVTIPPGMPPGRKLRVPGKGVERGKRTGDLLVEPRIDASLVELTPRARELAEQLREALQGADDEVAG